MKNGWRAGHIPVRLLFFISFACFIILSESKKVFHGFLEFLTDFIEKRSRNRSIPIFQISYMTCGDIQVFRKLFLLQIRFPDCVIELFMIKEYDLCHNENLLLYRLAADRIVSIRFLY